MPEKVRKEHGSWEILEPDSVLVNKQVILYTEKETT
jgi:hypothetical protein